MKEFFKPEIMYCRQQNELLKYDKRVKIRKRFKDSNVVVFNCL